MICADCGEREAAIFVRRSGANGGSRVDVALCEACARSRGVAAGAGGLELRIDGFIESFLDDGRSASAERRVACPLCGADATSIEREGRLGCSACVDTFRPEIRRRLATRDASSRPRRDPAHDPPPQAERNVAEPRFSSLPYPLSLPAFRCPGADAVEGDVILVSIVRVSRNFEAIPFPGGPSTACSGGEGCVAALLANVAGWEVRPFAAMGASARQALVELSGAPRHHVSAPGAAFAASWTEPLYALENETDHLRIFARMPGLDLGEAAGLAGAFADSLGPKCAEFLGRRFARDDEFGWISSRLEDCGAGSSVSVLAHLPALVFTGLLDKLFRALMSKGMQIRGAYADEGTSIGSLFEIAASGAVGASLEDIAASAGSAALTAAAAERRARAEIAKRDPVALIDAAGRSIGILANARRVGLEESAALVSSLRLAALAGMLRGADSGRLGGLLVALGPGALAAAAGTQPAATKPENDALRAIVLRDEVAGIEIADEEG